MNKYFLLTPKDEIEFLGEFNSFIEAWDFADYESQKPFIRLYNLDNLKTLQNKLSEILS